MSYDIKQSSTAYPLVFLMVDSTDHVTGKTGLTPTVTLSKAGGSFASPSGAVTEIANGWYKVAGNATDTGTLGPLILHATGTAADPVDILYNVVVYDPQDTVRLGLTAMPNVASGNSGAIVTAGTGTAQLSTSSGQVILQTGTGTGQLDFTSGVVKANTTQFAGSAITSASGIPEVKVQSIANNAITAAVLATDCIDNDAIATGAFASSAFANDCLHSAAFEDGCLTAAKIADGAIDLATFAADAQAIWGVVDSGTAQSATTSTVVLRSAFAASSTSLVGYTIHVYSSTNNKWATGYISAHDNGTDTVTVSPAWSIAPSGTILYIVTATPYVGLIDAIWDEATSGHSTAGTVGKALTDILADTNELQTDWVDTGRLDTLLDTAAAGGVTDAELGIITSGTCQAGSTSTTIVLASATSFTNDYLNGATVYITGGTGAGQRALITDWVSSSDTATVDGWITTPDNTSTYIVFATPPSSASVPVYADVQQINGNSTAADTLKLFVEILDQTTGQLDSGSLASGTITAAALASDAITAAKIQDGAIDAATFAAGAITSTVIATGAIDADAIASDAITAAKIATGAIDADALASDAVAEIWTTALTESYATDGSTFTGAQALYMLWSLLNDFSISSTTVTAKKLDGSTTSMTFTLNDATSPTAMNRAT